MRSFSQYIETKKEEIPVGENQYQALEKAIRLAYERYPSDTRNFFRGLNDPDIDDACEELERPPEIDPASNMFGKRRKKFEPDEIAPPAADTGTGDIEQD